MNGLRVGLLERGSGGDLTFRYAQDWPADTSPPISMSMPVSTSPYRGGMVEAFFDNLLPDDEALRARMQRILGAESTRPFDLLAEAGRDCVGALQLLDPEAELSRPTVDAVPLREAEIAERLRDRRERPLGMSRDPEGFRISIAGAQEKTALLFWRNGWYEPRGTTPTSHILKLPIGPAAHGIDLSDSVENEWLCLRLAEALGLKVARATPTDFAGVKALVVERFDRAWSSDGTWLMRLPQEDGCQALGVPRWRKYEADGGPGIAAIVDLLLRSVDPHADRFAFFRAAVVFWLLGAIDGHAKNVSFALLPGGRCRLTPFYDVLSAFPMIARRELSKHEIKMAMAADGKNRHYRWKEIHGRHWTTTARKARLPETDARAIVEDCAVRVPHAIDAVAAQLPSDFPSAVADPIFDGLRETARRI